ncbi:MAG: hypothetical protein DHS20C03_06230 [Minwuia thermotolerans]|nr:MAG: hypothetical protein DHS20C03_06230 [Minwuia thermotolerans]
MIRNAMAAAGLLVAVASPAAAGDTSKGVILALSCAACHGPDGASPGSIPAIDRLKPSEIEAALKAFRADTRPATVMGRIAKGYSDAEIGLLSGQFGRGR